MQKPKSKNLIFTALLILSFTCACSTCAFAEPDTASPQVQEIVADETLQEQAPAAKELKQEEINKLNEEMGLGEQKNIVVEDIKSTPNDNMALTKKVVPDTKSELTKMIKMFLKVMLAVALSSVVIFAILLIVRRFYAPKITADDLTSDEDSKYSLDTPQNKGAALKTFLDKTKGV